MDLHSKLDEPLTFKKTVLLKQESFPEGYAEVVDDKRERHKRERGYVLRASAYHYLPEHHYSFLSNAIVHLSLGLSNQLCPIEFGSQHI